MSQFLAPILLSVCAVSMLILCCMYLFETATSVHNAKKLNKLEEELVKKRISAIADQNIKIDRLIAYCERIIRQYDTIEDKIDKL